MFAFTPPRPLLSGLLSLLLLSGCAVKGSVRPYPAEPEAPVYESKVMVSEDLNPPAALEPDPPAEPDTQAEAASGDNLDEAPEVVSEPAPPTREELMEMLTQPVYFALDDAGLSNTQRDQLDRLAAFLMAEENSRLNLRIEGHCDDRGTREYNFALGARRAAVIARHLMQAGLPKDRLKTISYGKERPAYTGVSEFARSRNRRGDLLLKPIFEPPQTD